MSEISVIIPVYNNANNLPKLFDSLKKQTYKDFKVILLDDGSTDNSFELCKKYYRYDNNTQLVKLNHGGVSRTRNIAFNYIDSPYNTFIDGDDYIDCEYLERLYKSIKTNKTDLAICNYYENGLLIKVKKNNVNNAINNIVNNDATTGCFQLWNKIFKREIIINNNISFDENMSFGEDLIFVTKYIENCKKISFVDKGLYYYKKSNDGLFSKYRRSLLDDMLKCYNYISTIKPNSNLKPLSLKYYMYINNYIKGVVDNEQNSYKLIYDTFNNKTVKKIFSIISTLDKNELAIYKLANYELRIPKLIVMNQISLASLYALYQNDETNTIRKIRIWINNLKQ